MNLRQLEVFYAVMKTGTVSGAAKHLYVSQPNVTRVLAHTEQQLGFALFERIKGRLRPTREANLLLPEAEKVYQQLGQFRNLTNKIKAGEKHLTIGAPPILATILLAPIIDRISRETDYTVEISTGNRNELCEALLKNELDLAISFGDEAPPTIVQSKLLSKEMAVLAPQGSSDKEVYSLCELLNGDQPLIGLDPRDPLGLQLHQAIHSVEPNYHPRITVRSYSAAAELVAQGNCYAIVDPWTQQHYLNRVQSARLAPSIEVSVSLLHAEHYPLSIAAKWFVEQLHSKL
ncbi:LysR family transcriptional regulator [Vibrio bivalvicida]|uniref:LysR family transcriptional regulator n=1 Tax=Vibrio bivalvicida TaxID=1276888 RepID=A0A177Y3U8_9VIBR|nr:LysR family transcriptional regulator [Vibrio bivalvicida]OAJ95155.1 LysR family transcriptional regulator [Vibrio bivalvicida]